MNRLHLNLSTPQLLNFFFAFVLVTCHLSLLGCAGSSHPQLISPSEGPPTRRYLELYSEKQIVTLHFPAGVYTLDAADKIGYYYRAPRKIAERAGQGSVWRDGGIFVSKRDPQKLRGYVYRAGTITHVGNLSRVRHRFSGEDIPAEF
ncbi:MAG TPA: hypothetical protein VNX27_04145 [Chthoniobacterales bacterium]|jgi:hypothetical protein|nr:hypothetical protein [Chthoniobacterales bacterium]